MLPRPPSTYSFRISFRILIRNLRAKNKSRFWRGAASLGVSHKIQVLGFTNKQADIFMSKINFIVAAKCIAAKDIAPYALSKKVKLVIAGLTHVNAHGI